MKLTAILGSPRKDGNTDILAARVLDGAREVGIETEAIALRDLDIHACIACSRCWINDKPCVINDDMIGMYDLIGQSDVLLFATPVYWYAPTTLMKAFMDRMVPLNRPQGLPLAEGKAAVLVTAYEEEGPVAAEPLIRAFELSFEYLKWPFLDRVVADGVGDKGDVLQKTEILEAAYQIGRGLIDKVKR